LIGWVGPRDGLDTVEEINLTITIRATRKCTDFINNNISSTTAIFSASSKTDGSSVVVGVWKGLLLREGARKSGRSVLGLSVEAVRDPKFEFRV
jgi:hypothetical protein